MQNSHGGGKGEGGGRGTGLKRRSILFSSSLLSACHRLLSIHLSVLVWVRWVSSPSFHLLVVFLVRFEIDHGVQLFRRIPAHKTREKKIHEFIIDHKKHPIEGSSCGWGGVGFSSEAEKMQYRRQMALKRQLVRVLAARWCWERGGGEWGAGVFSCLQRR